MALKLKSKTTAVAALAVAGGALAVLNNAAGVATYLHNFNPFKNLSAGQTLAANPLVVGGISIAIGLAVGSIVAVRIMKRRHVEETNAREAEFSEMIAAMHKHRHLFDDTIRNFQSQLFNQFENNRMDSAKLCNFFGIQMHLGLDQVDAYFTAIEKNACRVSFYGLDEDRTLHPQAQHSHAGKHLRSNLSNEDIRLGTGMLEVQKSPPGEKPIYVAENIRSTHPAWKDPETDRHQEIYNSCITVAVQLRPNHNANRGQFKGKLPKERVIAGYLVLESTGDAFVTPGLEDAMASFADSLFDTLLQISRVSNELGGDFGWLYRAVTEEKVLELAAE